ncbi:ribosomal protein s18 domain-containing protein [Ditylenchus destructor]|uniref:Ribosomal protein s18 domain-containing protein n=1 Tax=Ditylenchus destructor TaxID=166010 RepID=A0AAD4NMX0_9BILA|nr:ribosomal protein s18 domain-containing protein [Ditylenchus destructor]
MLVANSVRSFSTTARRLAKKIQETVEGNVTTVSLVDVPEPRNKPRFKGFLAAKPENGKEPCSMCTCGLPVKLAYTDVLILEQFMREDGTVLPSEFTGLCDEQQQRLERCVMQAHWTGLFPDKTIPELDRTGWKRLPRYWKDDEDMFNPRLRVMPGNFYYIKRYNPRYDCKKDAAALFAKAVNKGIVKSPKRIAEQAKAQEESANAQPATKKKTTKGK